MLGKDWFFIIRNVFAKMFTILFLGLAIAILYSLFITVVNGIIKGTDIMQIFLSGTNTGIIALACQISTNRYKHSKGAQP